MIFANIVPFEIKLVGFSLVLSGVAPLSSISFCDTTLVDELSKVEKLTLRKSFFY